jgi:murein DD-endopeptidase MepM/ murein hydrolase activator NlpD
MSHDIRDRKQPVDNYSFGATVIPQRFPTGKENCVSILGLKLAAAAIVFGFGSITTQAASVPAPAGMGNYCSITWSDGGWAFASDTNGGDPCQWLLQQSSPGGTIRRKGLYASNNWNRVVYRCYPPNYGWVGIYEGWGNAPLTWAYNAAQNKPGCVFNVSPKSLPIFSAPFPLSASNSHATGFDFAKSPYNTLNVADFGQVGSAAATVVDNYGRDKSGRGYINGHDGHDIFLARNPMLYAVANGTVLKARSWLSPCSGSDSMYQKEVAIKHKVMGASGYSETFVSYYAHLASIFVSDGQSVTQGQVIGLSGNTGCSSAPHLHFGVVRLSNTADALLETLNFLAPPKHSDGADKAIDPYGFTPPKGFDPWAWKAYPSGGLSVNLWKTGQAPSLGSW